MKKRKSAPRVRRNPYERSLDHATKRLDRALVELAACQLQLQALNQEIPYLQTVIRALSPPTPVTVETVHGNGQVTTRPPIRSSIALSVPPHLEKYIGKTNGESQPQTENDFLKETGSPNEWHDR